MLRKVIDLEPIPSFILSGGQHCPQCGKEDVLAEGDWLEDGTDIVDFVCPYCEQKWKETYRLESVEYIMEVKDA
jgi:Zn ribbon nucleic-acid-binding protein